MWRCFGASTEPSYLFQKKKRIKVMSLRIMVDLSGVSMHTETSQLG